MTPDEKRRKAIEVAVRNAPPIRPEVLDRIVRMLLAAEEPR